MLFRRSAAGRRTPVLGGVFRSAQRQRRSFAAQLPARKWHRAVGVLRLRLHEKAGATSRIARRLVSAHAAPRPERGSLSTKFQAPSSKEIPSSKVQRAPRTRLEIGDCSSLCCLEIEFWSFIRHSSFGFRHFRAGARAQAREESRRIYVS